jgi:hypothetical protein
MQNRREYAEELKRLHLAFLLKEIHRSAEVESGHRQAAMRVAYLLNGGAILALLTYFGTSNGTALLKSSGADQVMKCLVAWVGGVSFAGFATVLAYLDAGIQLGAFANEAQLLLGKPLLLADLDLKWASLGAKVARIATRVSWALCTLALMGSVALFGTGSINLLNALIASTFHPVASAPASPSEHGTNIPCKTDCKTAPHRPR